MNKPTLLTTLILSLMFTATSFAEWTKVSENVDGDTFHVDFETIKKGGGYVYYWRLTDSIKPTEDGDLSSKTYDEVDCGSPRKYRGLSHLFYRESMGKGSTSNTINPKEPEWSYPFPDSVSESTLGLVCKAAELLP